MIMNKKTLKKLEYNKITELLAEQASSPGGKILCSHLAPMTSLAEITTAQEQTAAAFTRIVKKGRLSFSGVYTAVSYTHLDVYKRQPLRHLQVTHK